eukprot:10416380-Lingulodinium_polyedra.AAC.1
MAFLRLDHEYGGATAALPLDERAGVPQVAGRAATASVLATSRPDVADIARDPARLLATEQ